MIRIPTLAALLALAGAANAQTDNQRERLLVRAAKEVLDGAVKLPEKGIPKALLDDAQGFIIVPDLVKAGFVVGARRGKGVALLKNDAGQWSNPLFVNVAGGSIGLQAGVESTDLILLVRKRRSVEEILTAKKYTLGANAGLAVGPLGRDLQLQTDSKLKAGMYSYSRSRGVFGGLALGGGTMASDPAANQALYGVQLPTLDLAWATLTMPAEVGELKAALAKLSPPPAAR